MHSVWVQWQHWACIDIINSTMLPTCHTFVKSAQIQAVHGGPGVCTLCLHAPKTRHMCVVSTQLAVLMLYGDQERADHPPQALRCEVCHETFTNSKEITHHLQSVHHLALNDWVQSRDALDFNQPVCNHCLEQFDDIPQLRAHILPGYCPLFDYTLPCQLKPVTIEMEQAIRSGTIMDWSISPKRFDPLSPNIAPCAMQVTAVVQTFSNTSCRSMVNCIRRVSHLRLR